MPALKSSVWKFRTVETSMMPLTFIFRRWLSSPESAAARVVP